MHSTRWLGQVSAFLVVLAGVAAPLAGCGPSRAKPESGGTLQMNLIGTASGGTYRLSAALFDITGPTNTSLNASTDPTETVLSTTLSIGDYIIALNDGWVLERLDGATWVPEEAVLTSSNPTTFAIFANQTTAVAYQFAVNAGTVTIGSGTLEVVVNVNVCGNGVIEGAEQCDDGNNAGGDGCSGTCQFETGAGGVGGACTTHAQCSGYPADGGLCLDETFLGYPGGYCSLPCNITNPCPAGSVCDIELVTQERFCFQTCTSNADCRQGYSCEYSDYILANAFECRPLP